MTCFSSATLQAQAENLKEALVTLERALDSCCLAVPFRESRADVAACAARPPGGNKDVQCSCNDSVARTKAIARGLIALAPLPLQCTAYERLVAQLLRVELLGSTDKSCQAQCVLESVASEFGCSSYLGSTDCNASRNGSIADSNASTPGTENASAGVRWARGKILIAAAGQAVRCGDVRGALALLEQLPRDCESSSEAQLARAEVYRAQLADDAAAVRCLRRVVRQPYLSGTTALRAAELLMELQHPREASAAFEKAALLRPDDRSITYRLGKDNGGFTGA